MTTFLDSANAKFAMSVTPARLRVYRLANSHSLHSVSDLILVIDTALVRWTLTIHKGLVNMTRI